MIDGKKVAVVLGGGGMKGLAHIGALKALHRHGIVPDEYIGTSVGSFIAAMAAGGLSPEQIEDIGLSIRRHDILDYDWLGLLWRRGASQPLSRQGPARLLPPHPARRPLGRPAQAAVHH